NMRQAVIAGSTSFHYEKTDFELGPADYVFLLNFDCSSVVQRKNPLAAVLAFRTAFPYGNERAGMIIKTRNTHLLQTESDRVHWQQVLKHAGADHRIRILDKTMAEDELTALYELCDCYVSLHRSEGFGFGPAEAMSHGKPVIVTGYSSVTDFCTETTAKLVDYELRPVKSGEYPYLDPDRVYEWADSNIETASRHMRELQEAPEIGRRLGLEGQRLICAEYSVDALRRRYRARFEQLGLL
ncbi:MAG: glycosyltransferase, partial [Acidobacteriales bacterium]|nr:glycosyltransferase [Terriglobales bacterium]